MKKQIEVEGGELAIRNSYGDIVIIPKKDRAKVESMIKDKCWSCVDAFVDTLPVMSDYAEDGSLIPSKKIKVKDEKGIIKEYDISSKEYKDLYNSGKLMTYDKNTNTYIATPLKELVVEDKAPDWLKYKREYEKTNPKYDYIQKYLTPFAKSLGNTETNYPKRLDEEYEKKSLDYVSEQLIKNKPQGNLSRAEWLNSMTSKEEEFVKRNPKYQSSLWADTKRGLTSLIEQNPSQTIKNILNSPDYSDREKQEMLKEYADNPIMSKLGDASKILNPLTIPSKMVQAAYKDDYSFSDAIKGKKNKAGIVEDIVTDPLNLVGLSIWNKLYKTGKFKKLDDSYDAVKGLSKEEAISKLDKEILDNKALIQKYNTTEKQDKTWQLEELPGLHLKSTMSDGPISKIVEPKTGLINIEQALSIIGKESGGAEKVALVKQWLGENIPKKMDFNDFRKLIQENLIPLERRLVDYRSDYGLENIGYPSNKKEILQAIEDPSRIYFHKNSGKYEIEGIFGLNFPNKEAAINYTKSLPLENKTLILGNKNKFGRGSNAHGNPDETLGHIHFLRDEETPDVLTVTQIQSDAFQGTHRIMPKSFDKDFELKALMNMENQEKELLKLGAFNEAKKQKEFNLMKKAEIENFTQKQLLDKNHQKRYLQELVDYAGKRGDINKVRLPTPETAAKVQGYRKKETSVNYSPEHQTILKKYAEQPKIIKKLFGVEPKKVTDSKGNTWYEFDIPKKFKEGKGEIKAFGIIPPAIGIGLLNQQNNKTEKQ